MANFDLTVTLLNLSARIISSNIALGIDTLQGLHHYSATAYVTAHLRHTLSLILTLTLNFRVRVRIQGAPLTLTLTNPGLTITLTVFQASAVPTPDHAKDTLLYVAIM